MGADAFVAFCGIKLPLGQDDEDTLDACGEGSDPRCVAAHQVGLETHGGRMTDGEDCFLLVGRRLGWLGLEHDSHVSLTPSQLSRYATQVDAKLIEAGFPGESSLHF